MIIMPGVQVPYFKRQVGDFRERSRVSKAGRGKVKSFAECSLGVQRNESGAVFS